MRLRNAITSSQKRLLKQKVYSYSIPLISGSRIDVMSKKAKFDQFKNLHRFSLCYLRPVRIILYVKNSSKRLIILVCSKLQS